MGSSSSPPSLASSMLLANYTAGQQQGSDISTAIANADLNRINQTDQYGNTTSYAQNGTTALDTPYGTYQLPKYSQTTTMSPENANLYSGLQQLEGTNLQTGNNLATAAQSRLSTPLDLSSYFTNTASPTAADINSYAQTSWEQPFNQSWNLAQQRFDQSMADQGIAPGSQAYDNAAFNFSQNEQNALDQYATSMYGTAASAALGAHGQQLAQNAQNAQLATAQYEQPLNELAALQSGTQIASPQFQSVPSVNMPNVDYSSILNSTYGNQLSGYNAQQQANAANYGGLFGLGGSAITAGGLLASGGGTAGNLGKLASLFA